MVNASELKAGMAIRMEGQIYKVLDAEFKAGAGQAGGVVKTKLRNVSSGRMWEPHFRPDERLEALDAERQTMEFLYGDPASCTFMNPDTFEQVEIPRAILGPAEKFLQEGMKLPVEFFDGRPISMVFPAAVEARVADTAPPFHSQQDNTWKPATLENGVLIQVPLFIASGETVRVEVETGRYLERARIERKRGA
ncbi:MAG: elongation factor P [Acidobacteria bacterium]|nr:elongation factor P [Acidobacteriota bacterium]MBI3663032.1 elongation factor P [Acidobacteriota bacterium]